MDLSQAAYYDEDFYGEAFFITEMSKKVFVNCNFTGADFTDIDMVYGCKFENCNLTGTRMNGVRFRNCAFLNCAFTGTRFFATVMEDCKMTGSEFKSLDFSMLSIEGGDWSFCQLRFAEFRKKTLKGIRFDGTDLTESKFIDCKIQGCTFAQAIAAKTSFYQSDLRGSDLSALDLTGLDLRQAKVDLEQCILIAEAVGARYVP